jgi:hypothetical protein
MLTLPILTRPIEAIPGARVLIVGRSENVLSEAVEILRSTGHAAGATNQFADVMDLFDLTAVDIWPTTIERAAARDCCDH